MILFININLAFLIFFVLLQVDKLKIEQKNATSSVSSSGEPAVNSTPAAAALTPAATSTDAAGGGGDGSGWLEEEEKGNYRQIDIYIHH